jgi:hypothetical protein
MSEGYRPGKVGFPASATSRARSRRVKQLEHLSPRERLDALWAEAQSETDFYAWIRRCAKEANAVFGLDWLYYHTLNSVGSDEGFPDCFLLSLRRKTLLFLEVKTVAKLPVHQRLVATPLGPGSKRDQVHAHNQQRWIDTMHAFESMAALGGLTIISRVISPADGVWIRRAIGFP